VPSRLRIYAAVAALAVVALALDVVSNGNLFVMLAPLLAVGLLALIWVIPLRHSVVALFFLGAVLEAPYEAFACYQFHTPWYKAGEALLGNLNMVTHVSALKMSGFDLMVIYLLLVHAVRRMRGKTLDGNGFVPLPRPIRLAAALSFACVVAFWFYGLAFGGDFGNSLWQMQKVLYIPILVVLLNAGLRGPQDLHLYGKALVVAAAYRGALATFIHFTVQPGGEPLQWATTHADSILFVDAVALLVILRSERVRLARPLLVWPAALLILSGMVFNNRRLCWVSLAGALLIYACVSPWTPLKRFFARALVVLSPLLILYVGAGWNRATGVFAPVATIRSVVDSKSDSSALWRDRENANLAANIEQHSLFGVGYGHQYIEYKKLDDVSSMYPQYRYIPHNSALALFAFTGAFGVAGIWSILIVTVFLAARAFHRAHRPEDRAAALLAIVMVFVYVNQVYGDIGVSQWISPLTVAPAAAIAGKLALTTGAWPWPRRARRTSAVPAASLSASLAR
jgi:hypothetical protein